MKHIFYTFLFVTISFGAFAQITVDAGADHYFCETDTSFQLGGNPTIVGGTPPYQIKWETTFQYGIGSTFTAAYFLDDTSAANPTYTHDNIVDVLYFHLIVTDSLGVTAYDTVSIYPSSFVATLGQCVHMIEQGDTVSLVTHVSGGIEPLTYQWTSNYNISDTSISNAEVWPDTSFTYNCIITDVIGCTTGDNCYIWVFPTKTAEAKTLSAKIYPNPTNGFLTIEAAEINQVSISDMTGKVVYYDNQFRGQNVDISFLENGLYFLKVQNSKGEVGVFKVIRK